MNFQLSSNRFHQILLLFIFSLVLSCEKEVPADDEPKEPEIEYELPSITIKSVSDITIDGAISGGNITDDGGADITARGVVWNTTENPTLDNCDGKTTDGEGKGEFTSNLQGLQPETVYYLKAYATNIEGTAYSQSKEFVTAEKKFAGGSGTQTEPYLIETPGQLDSIRFDLDKHYKQIADIDLSNYSSEDWIPEGHWIPIGLDDNYFTGSYDGQGFKIENLSIDLKETQFVGLFSITKQAELKNISIYNANIIGSVRVGTLAGSYSGILTNCYAQGNVSGNSYVGGLIGSGGSQLDSCSANVEVNGNSSLGGLVGAASGEIKNCFAEGDVGGGENYPNAGSMVGGLIGINYGFISNCYATGNVYGESELGGLVGSNNMEITDCYATGNVYGENDLGGLVGWNIGKIESNHANGDVMGGYRVGGLVGDNKGKVIKSYTTGKIEGITNVGGISGNNIDSLILCYSLSIVIGKERVGGLTGDNKGRIIKTYAKGNVSGEDYVGGLVGHNSGGTISNSYSTGFVERTNINNSIKRIGGLVGSSPMSIEYCFYDKDTSGQYDDDTKRGGIPKTTTEMMQQYTFYPHWDFDEVWNIDEGESYPYFKWQK
jgi:hypothetical protein